MTSRTGVFRRALPLLALAALAACTRPGAERSAGVSRFEGPSRSTPAPDPADPARPIVYPHSDFVENEKGHPGGTLRIATSTDTLTLDFQLISLSNAKWLGRILYDNLVYLDEQGVAQPWLAKSWTISPDGKTYTFFLRDDVTFSDGTPFDAHAVLVNLRRMRDPASKAAMTTAYLAPYVDGVVVSDHVFQANLSSPYSPFLNVLAQSWLGLISPKQILENPKSIAEHPIGTGPFTLEKYIRQQGSTYVRRKDYHWGPPFIGHSGPANLERIEVAIIPESMSRHNAILSGEYDLNMDVSAQYANDLRKDPNYVLSSRVNLGNPYRAITFNTSRPPFDDVRVRRAFALAIDREGLSRIMGFGEFIQKSDFLSATTRFYDPSFRHTLDFDPAEAARLLDAAGWSTRDPEGYRTKDGKRLAVELVSTEAASPSALLVAVQSDVRRIGIELLISQLPQSQTLARRNANRYDAMAGGIWHTNTPDGLYILYHSNQITGPKFVGQNSARLRDEKLDDLLLRARRSTSDEEMKVLYSAAQQRLTELAPTVPIYENHTLLGYHKDLKGVVFDTSHNIPVFTSLWLDRPSR